MMILFVLVIVVVVLGTLFLAIQAALQLMAAAGFAVLALILVVGSMGVTVVGPVFGVGMLFLGVVGMAKALDGKPGFPQEPPPGDFDMDTPTPPGPWIPEDNVLTPRDVGPPPADGNTGNWYERQNIQPSHWVMAYYIRAEMHGSQYPRHPKDTTHLKKKKWWQK